MGLCRSRISELRDPLKLSNHLGSRHYTRKVQVMEPYSMSPFEDLNGFRYHDNWLHNFLIASSLNGRGTAKPNKHKLD